jgi:hypothetical protein
MYKKFLLVVFLFPVYLFAQQKEQTIWLALINSTRLSHKFSTHLDVQIRTADDADYIRNLIFRPGITYHINKKNSLTAGYVYAEILGDPEVVTATNIIEHRPWEQYTLKYKINSTAITHRFRAEQRFLQRNNQNIFSQRLRYLARAVVPLKRDSVFKKGFYLSLQDEVFFHIQNKKKMNNKVFDQNRLSVSAGYRLSEKMDMDAGYLFNYIEGLHHNTANHALLLTLNTRF